MLWCLCFKVVFHLHAQNGSGNIDFEDVLVYKTSRPDTAFYLAKSIYLNAKKQGDQLRSANAALELGEILFYLADFDNSNSYLIEAIETFSGEGEQKKLAESYTWQGTVTQYARQYSLAFDSYQNALEIYIHSGDSVKIGELYGWMGHYYEKTGIPDTALLFQHLARNILQQKGNSKLPLARIFDNLGSIHEDRGNYDSARYYFIKALEINRSHDEVNNQIVNLNNIGDTYRKKGQFFEALHYTDSALKLAESYNLEYQIRSAHRDLSKIYFELNDYEKAFQNLETTYNLYTEILNEENTRRIALLQTIYETERKENQIALLEKDKRLNRIFRYGMLGIFILIFSGAILVIRNQRMKVNQNKKILEQKTQLFKNQEELNKLELKNSLLKEEKLKAELENQKLKEGELRQNIVLKSQLITSHTLQIIRKNNFLESLKCDLQKIKKSEKKDRIRLANQLVKSIDHDMTKDENWEDFNIIFGQVHKDFFSKIKGSFPEITPSELRLCSLLKLNLHSQEIATILGVSVDSLRIARYRLRKKLQLDKNDNLIGYLMNF